MDLSHRWVPGGYSSEKGARHDFLDIHGKNTNKHAITGFDRVHASERMTE
jgi:hypothetical protein